MQKREIAKSRIQNEAKKENAERKTPKMKFFCAVNINVDGRVGMGTHPHPHQHHHTHTHTLTRISSITTNTVKRVRRHIADIFLILHFLFDIFVFAIFEFYIVFFDVLLFFLSAFSYSTFFLSAFSVNPHSPQQPGKGTIETLVNTFPLRDTFRTQNM